MNAPAAPEAFDQPRPAGHPPVKSGRVGVLLVNLGTPEATDYWSMRRYLDEFLSDRRVIETPRWLWWPILNLVILTRRPGAKGRDYDSIWNKERDEGPLKTITRAQSEKLGRLLAARVGARPIVVDWAMRYGKPSIANRLAALQAAGCDRILLVPLYPQYCAATSRDGLRQGVRRAEGDALAADAARRRALFRRSRLYRRARALRPGPRSPSSISSPK